MPKSTSQYERSLIMKRDILRQQLAVLKRENDAKLKEIKEMVKTHDARMEEIKKRNNVEWKKETMMPALCAHHPVETKQYQSALSLYRSVVLGEIADISKLTKQRVSELLKVDHIGYFRVHPEAPEIISKKLCSLHYDICKGDYTVSHPTLKNYA